jgi:hypothetical protein
MSHIHFNFPFRLKYRLKYLYCLIVVDVFLLLQLVEPSRSSLATSFSGQSVKSGYLPDFHCWYQGNGEASWVLERSYREMYTGSSMLLEPFPNRQQAWPRNGTTRLVGGQHRYL